MSVLKELNVIQMIDFVFDRAENMVGKGEHAGYQQCFQKLFHCFLTLYSTDTHIDTSKTDSF